MVSLCACASGAALPVALRRLQGQDEPPTPAPRPAAAARAEPDADRPAGLSRVDALARADAHRRRAARARRRRQAHRHRSRSIPASPGTAPQQARAATRRGSRSSRRAGSAATTSSREAAAVSARRSRISTAARSCPAPTARSPARARSRTRSRSRRREQEGQQGRRPSRRWSRTADRRLAQRSPVRRGHVRAARSTGRSARRITSTCSKSDGHRARALELRRHAPRRRHRLGACRSRSCGRAAAWSPAYTYAKPTRWRDAPAARAHAGAACSRPRPTRTARSTAYRIGDAEWMHAADVHVFTPLPPPPLLQPNERWIDVDLDAQILVAFEGTTPVYSTLVSSGAKDTPTETGLYRIWLKESEADMKGLNGEDPYSVATVPWTSSSRPRKASRCTPRTGTTSSASQRSHGCVNLAPRDARWLYFWSDPQVPPGWTIVGRRRRGAGLGRARPLAPPTRAPSGRATRRRSSRRASRTRRADACHGATTLSCRASTRASAASIARTSSAPNTSASASRATRYSVGASSSYAHE